MKIKHMGRTGLKVSEICLGTMTFGNQCDEPTSFAIMDRAVEGGVSFFDTADVYPLGGTAEMRGRTEEFIGNWMSERKMRDKIVLATKVRGQMGSGPNEGGLSRKHIMEAIEGSLLRLKTDYVDLYQFHSPDPETPIEESLRAMDDLVQQGKVRYIGCSNFQAYQICKALWTSDKHNLARFDCDQPRYNLLFREIEHEVLPLCREEGIGVIAYNPLAGGFLTGRYKPNQDVEQGTRFALREAGRRYQERYWHEAQFAAVEKLKEFFQERERVLAQVAIAWVLAQPGITSAIVGASRPEQLDQTLPATDVTLTPEEVEFLDSIWYMIPRSSNPAVALR